MTTIFTGQDPRSRTGLTSQSENANPRDRGQRDQIIVFYSGFHFWDFF